MLRNQTNFHAAQQRHSLSCASLLLLCLASLAGARAADVPTLYSAEVPYRESAGNPRENAYRAALISVLARVSGSELSRNTALIDELFPVPAAYVTQFRAGTGDTLWVSFDDEAIERILRAGRQTVWGRDRPLTLVWLAVDWGGGQREIVVAGDAEGTRRQGRSIDRNRLLRARILEIAEKRGLPIMFPLLDSMDLQEITFSDIWGGFDERVIDASKRYAANSILIGRIRPSSSSQDRWTYIFGAENRSWTGSAEQIVGQIADTLASEFAVGGDARLETVVFNVSGIQSVDDYGSVQGIVGSLSLIESYRISAVSADVLSYEAEVRGGAERLRRALRFAGLLETESNDVFHHQNEFAVLDFFLATKASSSKSPNEF